MSAVSSCGAPRDEDGGDGDRGDDGGQHDPGVGAEARIDGVRPGPDGSASACWCQLSGLVTVPMIPLWHGGAPAEKRRSPRPAHAGDPKLSRVCYARSRFGATKAGWMSTSCGSTGGPALGQRSAAPWIADDRRRQGRPDRGRAADRHGVGHPARTATAARSAPGATTSWPTRVPRWAATTRGPTRTSCSWPLWCSARRRPCGCTPTGRVGRSGEVKVRARLLRTGDGATKVERIERTVTVTGDLSDRAAGAPGPRSPTGRR